MSARHCTLPAPLSSVLGIRAPTRGSSSPGFCFDALLGRLGELSSTRASAALTMAFGVVLDAQRQGETCAWITLTHSAFHPPDVADNGVDLRALAVIRAPGARAAGRAADHLARSGAFGLIVIDLTPPRDHVAPVRVRPAPQALPMPLQSRLSGLAKKHAIALLFLTAKDTQAPSLSSLISWRGHPQARHRGHGRFQCRLRTLKDKRNPPGWVHEEMCRGPLGVR